MADLVLKDNAGKIWENSDSKIFISRSMSQETTNSGKVAEYSSHFNIVSGYCQTWYDDYSTNNLAQNTAANQFRVGSNAKFSFISGTDVSLNWIPLAYFYKVLNIRTIFIVFRHININGATGQGQFIYRTTGGYYIYIVGSTLTWTGSFSVKLNNTVVGSGTSLNLGYYYVLTIQLPVNDSYGYWLTNGGAYNSFGQELGHMTLYNRILNDMEKTYNYNALKSRYAI